MDRKMVLVTAKWCAPCRHVKKTLVPEVEQECPGQVEVIDIEDDRENLVKKTKITRVPAIVLMEDGQVADVYVPGTYTGSLPDAGQLAGWLKGGVMDGAG